MIKFFKLMSRNVSIIIRKNIKVYKFKWPKYIFLQPLLCAWTVKILDKLISERLKRTLCKDVWKGKSLDWSDYIIFLKRRFNCKKSCRNDAFFVFWKRRFGNDNWIISHIIASGQYLTTRTMWIKIVWAIPWRTHWKKWNNSVITWRHVITATILV